MNESDRRERGIHQLFEIGIVLKGVNAFLELSLGALLLFTPVLNNLIIVLVDNALVEDPDNFFASHIHSFLAANPNAQFYGGLYLLAQGVVKAFLVVAILRGKLWAYPAAISLLSLFVAYAAVTIARNHSIALTILTVFDLLIMWLIWHEYRHKQKRA